ncbi:MAG: type II toxin-antitoxin system HicB family antitoxin [Spirochaetaceae bacterium]|jgi:predicted RNase H-like HicB family nuclease|nr:type II toxin-antitoxin system HicB family antitoxin [Spirochaetaceae bacterium]
MKAYPAHIWKEDDGSFSVEFPDLSGCFSSGETLEEAKRMAREALGGYLESLDSRGLTIPEPFTSPAAGDTYLVHTHRKIRKRTYA